MKRKKILKGITFVISVLILILSLGVLGESKWLTTQIATIFFPYMFSWVLIISSIIILIYVYKLTKVKWKFLTLGKMNIIILIMVIISFLATSFEFVNYKQAIRENGADINPFSSITAFGKMSKPDEKIVYATKEREDLSVSVYKPEKKSKKKLKPVYVYIHGGGWSSSDSESNSNYHKIWRDEGYVSFSVNYRLAREDRPTWNKQIEDVNDAMKWIRDNAKKYGGDPDRIVLSGESAGGNLALVYGGKVSQGTLDGPLPKALTVMYPAIDMKWTSENARFMTPFVLHGIVERYIGGSLENYPNRVRAIDPTTYVNKKLPPTLIIHGEKDTMVTIDGSRKYINELENLGVKNQFAEIPYSNHGTSIKVNFDITMNFLKNIQR
ncbi:alpha/beta hydrolase [Mammaliicoccus sciuri]|uniref:alpha/beta hydrolase n=1 Tax=Mammaliicoccus sciuri TaxID=1296 RepID=UPI001AAF912D|nr:alpha/beta hydrolase [Mammaliicoccus sciuri]MBO3080987.1 alpha/beta hydrolase [Mammaliicoccus sciuri]MEB6232753.1 alpha/beta hydrolase [Mammaliicoccus sciuri]